MNKLLNTQGFSFISIIITLVIILTATTLVLKKVSIQDNQKEVFEESGIDTSNYATIIESSKDLAAEIEASYVIPDYSDGLEY